MKQRSIYIDEQSWQQLRRLAFEQGATASSLVASAVAYFLDGASDRVKAGIIEHAKQRVPGVSPRTK